MDNADIILRIKKEYADAYDSMTWLSRDTAEQASRLREQIVSDIFKTAGPSWEFSKTKLISHDISPGCVLCGKGEWSCLFINGICNARCFYCPSSQKDKGDPITSTIEFSSPRDYADYVTAFNIKGVSFSGGEPFLTFDRVIEYLKALREKVSHPLYIWMYTNGILVTEDKLKALRDNGLDELRFDLSANDYKLDSLEKAVGIIPAVTVEIPAIPEDLEDTKQLMGNLHSIGVNYLNLHQIRCTQFNRPKLQQKGYTFVHGPGVTILETEQTALELIRYGLDQKIDLPVNYCSFTYRHQHQRAGAQRRNALMIKAPHEEITDIGHIRALSLWGEPEKISAVHDDLVSLGADPQLWKLPKKGDHLFIHPSLLPGINHSGLRLKVGYSGTALRPSVSFRHLFREIPLNSTKKVVVERFVRLPGLWLEGEQIHQFASLLLEGKTDRSIKNHPSLPEDLLTQLTRFESVAPGLAAYY